MKKETIKVTGMTCASCVRAIERNVSKVEGVSTVNVNLATERVEVEYDAGSTEMTTIKET
ncbi:MAG TPA: P-type ATPase, K/Mg/Cd/Cu/Zn/Na/Ca/Na/H-transporter, partial [Firmicutes bacterium]|nr:P-type ATPase, K/Mg/Cd/Cu/Zn/Na/Ca/Na/H-transporter [Bacillota bacterium]